MLKKNNQPQSISELIQKEKIQEGQLPPTLSYTLQEFEDCSDLTHRSFPQKKVDILYFGNLVDKDQLERDVFQAVIYTNMDTQTALSQSQFIKVVDSKECIHGILAGGAAVFYEEQAYMIEIAAPPSRAITPSQADPVITGPHEGFTEEASTNLSLIRKRLQSSHLKVIKLHVGEITKNDVYVLYIKDIVRMEFVEDMKQRIMDIEMDAVFDTNMLLQLVEDDVASIFPQYLTTERPDAIASKLVAGKVIVLMAGSPTAFCAPSTFFEFFTSSDDYYQRWLIGTSTRLLRFIALIITISFTALYVSITTFHYEMIPESLLLTLSESRSRVPFPPLIEALLMEATIELLREAGAQLPTKIGQTIGIVGGIVIGQAAVQAGLTSKILIIAVASSAIASFVIPSYEMSASLRVLRFGFILIAAIYGNLGLALGLVAVVIHMCGLTSLRSSYLTGIAPLKPKDWKDIFIRAPFSMLRTRPSQSKSTNNVSNKMKR
ncbi:spore germination protein [Brevibacillus daliensis]|uniref:spore germination protein n=1 Tax=Brevibacillus daliensis TaxID=2892995 RepID=UPI001E561149|nr:spore germination protein [Brevibacillus daliensis]